MTPLNGTAKEVLKLLAEGAWHYLSAPYVWRREVLAIRRELKDGVVRGDRRHELLETKVDCMDDKIDLVVEAAGVTRQDVAYIKGQVDVLVNNGRQ